MHSESENYKQVAVVLPSLDPDKKFAAVVDGLVSAGFANIVIVDDGSCEEKQKWFDYAQTLPGVTVIHHGVNKGKGRGLKTAFSFVKSELKDAKGVVTIDGDGQHLLKDIISCCEIMIENPGKVVLGCRDFSLPGIPPRSVTGNRTTSRLFKLLFGIKLSDTQTGLRAVPSEYLDFLISVSGERFEYETNMLLSMYRSHIEWIEHPIETVYDPEDYSSHYNAVKDSWRIFKVMAGYIFGGDGK